MSLARLEDYMAALDGDEEAQKRIRKTERTHFFERIAFCVLCPVVFGLLAGLILHTVS